MKYSFTVKGGMHLFKMKNGDLRKHMDWNISRAYVKDIAVALLAAEIIQQTNYISNEASFSLESTLGFMQKNVNSPKLNSSHTVLRCSTRSWGWTTPTKSTSPTYMWVCRSGASSMVTTNPAAATFSSSSTRLPLRVGLAIRRYMK